MLTDLTTVLSHVGVVVSDSIRTTACLFCHCTKTVNPVVCHTRFVPLLHSCPPSLPSTPPAPTPTLPVSGWGNVYRPICSTAAWLHSGEVARGMRSLLRCRFSSLSKGWPPSVSLARWRSRLPSVVFIKCRQPWSVIPKLLMLESHGRAAKPVTLVWMMDALWAARFSQHYRESPWAVKQALVIDAVSPPILFTFFPLLGCICYNFFHPVGRNTQWKACYAAGRENMHTWS